MACSSVNGRVITLCYRFSSFLFFSGSLVVVQLPQTRLLQRLW